MNYDNKDEIHLYGTHVLVGTNDEGVMLVSGGKKGCVFKVSQTKTYGSEDIRRIRRECGMTAEDIADILGMNIKIIKSWENDEKSPGTTASRLLEMMDSHRKLVDLYVEE